MQITLDELKAENAKAEAGADDKLVDDVQDDIKDEYVDVTDDVKADDTDGEPAEDGEQKVELESWQLTEDAEASENDNKGGFKPDAGYAVKRLKGKLKAKDDELEKLKAQVEALEAGSVQVPSKQDELGPRPTREQFDYDDDAYDAAVDSWNDKKFDMKLRSHAQASQDDVSQKQQQEAYAQAQKQSLEDHYGRAQRLIDSGKVTADSYTIADTKVRQTLDNINPGNGDQITDAIIQTLNSLGEGSEKVMYLLGNNPSKLQELQSKLLVNDGGLQASVFLGSLHSQVKEPSKRRSQAPKPSAKVDGEGGGNGNGTFKKAYDKARKANDTQGVLNARRAAKAEGIDVSNW